MIILGIIALVVIPPEKLPEVARQLARFIGDLRRSTAGIWDDLKQDAGRDLNQNTKPKSEVNVSTEPQAEHHGDHHSHHEFNQTHDNVHDLHHAHDQVHEEGPVAEVKNEKKSHE